MTADGVRYPDIFVDRCTSASKGTDLATTEPVFVAEILSVSSRARDLRDKVTDYTSLPSLLYYAVLSQDEPHLWLWSREMNGWNGPAQVTGIDGMLELPDFGIVVELSELYKGIVAQMPG